MFRANGWISWSEVDDFQDGCDPGTSTGSSGNQDFKDDSIEGLIRQLMDFCSQRDPGNVLLDSCEEIGRVDIQVYQKEDSYAADERDIEAWKKGELKLWLVTYTFYVEKCERVSTVGAIEGAEIG